MARSVNINYFGEQPTIIVMQTSSAFDGTTDQSADPTLSPGTYTFAPQAGGGLFNFHTDPVEVLNVEMIGGTATVVKKITGIAGSIAIAAYPVRLAPGEFLAVSGAGPTLVFTSRTARSGQVL